MLQWLLSPAFRFSEYLTLTIQWGELGLGKAILSKSCHSWCCTWKLCYTRTAFIQLILTKGLLLSLQVGGPGLGKTTFMKMLQQQVSSVSKPYEEDEQACLLKQRAEAAPGEYFDIQAKLEEHFVANPTAFSCVLEHVDGPFSYTYTLQVRHGRGCRQKQIDPTSCTCMLQGRPAGL